jgi:hypothetical protein
VALNNVLLTSQSLIIAHLLKVNKNGNMAILSTEPTGHSYTDKSRDNCIVRGVLAIFMKAQSGTILIMNHSIFIHESINRV